MIDLLRKQEKEEEKFYVILMGGGHNKIKLIPPPLQILVPEYAPALSEESKRQPWSLRRGFIT